MARNFRNRIEKAALGEIGPRTHDLLSLAVRKTAFDVEAHAKVNCPVGETGNLRGSIKAEPIGDLLAEVQVGMEYGAYVELGTTKAAAQPFLSPAMEAAEPEFRRAIAAAIERGAGS